MKLNSFTIGTIKNFFSQGHERTIRAKKNVSIAFITKTLSLIISFLIVPITLNYVGKVEYGIWMTISSIINLFAFFDIGLGNGLRNKLSEALALHDEHLARIYISSVFVIITIISIMLFILFLIMAHFISWNAVLNTNIVSNHKLFTIVTMVFFFFCVGFVFKLISSVLAALQLYAINYILLFAAQLLGLVAIFILVKTTDGSLFKLCLVYGSQSAIVMLIANIILFSGYLKKYRPSLKFIRFKEAMPLLNLGLKFFLGQILYLSITEISIILVVQFFGPQNVTVYNLATKFITITSVAYIMILNPFLTAFTEAYTKKEFSWIKTIIKKINYIWLLTSIVTIVLAVNYKWLFQLWVGNEIIVPDLLIYTLTISNIIGLWGSTYSLFLNGIGKIHLQLYMVGGQACLFIPLSYVFYKLGLGLSAIVFAQIVLQIANAIVFTEQYKKIINQTAVGIWIR